MDLSLGAAGKMTKDSTRDVRLLYEAYRVMPYSWGAETPLANFEIRLDDAMRPRQDPALSDHPSTSEDVAALEDS